MNSSINMSVSSLTRTGDKKAVYVLFTDEGKTAEFEVPEGKLINCSGFTKEDISQLKDYIANETDYIMRLAKEVNPMKAFMKN